MTQSVQYQTRTPLQNAARHCGPSFVGFFLSQMAVVGLTDFDGGVS